MPILNQPTLENPDNPSYWFQLSVGTEEWWHQSSTEAHQKHLAHLCQIWPQKTITSLARSFLRVPDLLCFDLSLKSFHAGPWESVSGNRFGKIPAALPRLTAQHANASTFGILRFWVDLRKSANKHLGPAWPELECSASERILLPKSSECPLLVETCRANGWAGRQLGQRGVGERRSLLRPVRCGRPAA